MFAHQVGLGARPPRPTVATHLSDDSRDTELVAAHTAALVFGAVPRLNDWQIDWPRVTMSVGDADTGISIFS